MPNRCAEGAHEGPRGETGPRLRLCPHSAFARAQQGAKQDPDEQEVVGGEPQPAAPVTATVLGAPVSAKG